MQAVPAEAIAKLKLPFYRQLYFQVVFAIIIGVLLGYFEPEYGAAMKPFGDAFIKLIKMIIAPVIFLTIVAGIAKIGDLRHVGKIGLKALIYFEVLTTLIGDAIFNVAAMPADTTDRLARRYRAAYGDDALDRKAVVAQVAHEQGDVPLDAPLLDNQVDRARGRIGRAPEGDQRQHHDRYGDQDQKRQARARDGHHDHRAKPQDEVAQRD